VTTGFWWGNLREKDHWGDPDVDGRTILRRIFRKWKGVIGTGKVVVPDRDKWRGLVSTVMKFRVP
jgi:hypothetical protein